MSSSSNKLILSQTIMAQAYNHPKASECLMLDTPTICPRCQCEFTFIIQDEPGRKILSCQHCGMVFKPKELAA